MLSLAPRVVGSKSLLGAGWPTSVVGWGHPENVHLGTAKLHAITSNFEQPRGPGALGRSFVKLVDGFGLPRFAFLV